MYKNRKHKKFYNMNSEENKNNQEKLSKEEQEAIDKLEQEAAEKVEEEEKKEEQKEVSEEEKLNLKLADAEEKIAAEQDRYLRLSAEFDNYRKRTLKERSDLIKIAGEKTITAILPVLDDFERAMDNLKKDEAAAEILKGVELIYDKFIKILKQEGLSKIETDDMEFNTDFHEAIAMIPAPEENKKGKILDCVQTGYMLGDKVIRHAKVAVGQ